MGVLEKTFGATQKNWPGEITIVEAEAEVGNDIGIDNTDNSHLEEIVGVYSDQLAHFRDEYNIHHKGSVFQIGSTVQSSNECNSRAQHLTGSFLLIGETTTIFQGEAGPN